MDFEFNYGLIVVDPSEPGDEKSILHFCGYSEPITRKMVDSLREELKNDPEFGLQDKWDKVDIFEASEEIVAEYQEIFRNEDE
jgi:hypothetical protein